MRIIATALASAMLIAAAPASAKDAPAPSDTATSGGRSPDAARRTYVHNFKDIALASCIATAYAAEAAAAADAKATAGAIFEWSSFDVEGAAKEVEALVRRTLDHEYLSIQGPEVRLDLLKCIDMYHGEELRELARRFVPDPEMTYDRANVGDRANAVSP